MKKPMIHLKKKSRARAKEEGREIRCPITILPLTMIICLPLTRSPRHPLVKLPFRWDGLYQMEILDKGASNLAQSKHLDNCAYMC
jgi:hypothetical protein